MKKPISIEALLTWAFVEELPKVGTHEGGGPSAAPSTWGILSDVIMLGTMIDKGPNRYGVVSGFVWTGEPHPDAIIVGDAVRTLAVREGFEIMDGWNPFPEYPDDHGIISAEVSRMAHEIASGRGGRVNGRHIVGLVTTAAILKRGPDWQVEAPKVVTVQNGGKDAWFVKRVSKDSMGRRVEYEDKGFHQRHQRPMKGAYRKYRLEQSIRGAVISRLDWQLWQSALETLRDSLCGSLTAHDLLPFYPDRSPWSPTRIDAVEMQASEFVTE